MSSYRNRDDIRRDIQDANFVARRAGLSVAGWILVTLVFFAVIGIGTWAFKVITSDVKGKGDATRQVNSAENRLGAETRFRQLYEGITADDDKINLMASTANSEMDDTNLQGLMLSCTGRIGEYNAMVTAPTTAKFRPIELPTRIGQDIETDCKPDTTPTPIPTR